MPKTKRQLLGQKIKQNNVILQSIEHQIHQSNPKFTSPTLEWTRNSATFRKLSGEQISSFVCKFNLFNIKQNTSKLTINLIQECMCKDVVSKILLSLFKDYIKPRFASLNASHLFGQAKVEEKKNILHKKKNVMYVRKGNSKTTKCVKGHDQVQVDAIILI